MYIDITINVKSIVFKFLMFECVGLNCYEEGFELKEESLLDRAVFILNSSVVLE